MIMKRCLSDFTKEEKFLVKDLFLEGYSPEEISIFLDLSFQEVIFVLKRMLDGLDIRSIISQAEIEEEKILIVSDTHIGSKYENFEYIKEAYRFAHDEQGIKVALHGGDLLQSTFTNVQPQYRNEVDQVEHCMENYPLYEDMINYILLGNHDYNTLKKDPFYLQRLMARPDFNILGFKRAYLTWLKDLISIYHTTKKYPLSIPPLDVVLNLKGHSHQLSYNKQSSITIPTLSDDMLQHSLARPGFLIGTKKKDELQLEAFYFRDSLHYGGKILTKKLK